jgi:hypothetical protein
MLPTKAAPNSSSLEVPLPDENPIPQIDDFGDYTTLANFA